jgi:tRNA A37 threonylcarbamoyladenosine modification protein TsaB
MADYIVHFIDDFLEKFYKYQDKKIEKLVFQSGPMSFTSHRIVNSIAKGLALTDKNIKLFAVSSFLTYSLEVSAKYSEVLVCISTMKGDFFTCEYKKSKICNIKIKNLDQINAETSKVFFEEDPDFNDVNFAATQLIALNSSNVNADGFITSGFSMINYGYTPQYHN